jgi:hypothetical protein
MRDNMSGRRGAPGSVPSVSGNSPWNKGPVLPPDSPWNKGPIETGRAPWNAAPAQRPGAPWQAGGPGQPPGAPGGSFLGTAAAAAAGAVGGSLLMNSIRGLFGGQQGQAHAAIDPSAGAATPGGSSPLGGGNLAREAGLNDIGGSNRPAAYDNSSAPQRTGLFDTAQGGAEGGEDVDDGSFGDDFDGDFGGDFGGGDDTV